MARTALQIAQDAAVKLGIAVPSELFAATGRTEIELRRALVEAADKIVNAHDWSQLKTLKTDTGDGSTTEYALPSDFLRMPKDARVHSSRLTYPVSPITPEEWLHLETQDFDTVVLAWTIFQGNVVYRPALVTGETAKYWYVSENAITGTTGNKAEFTADDDTFRLDDRTLELTLLFTWRAQKKLDYQEEKQAADLALSRQIERDKGARVIKQPTRQMLRGDVAYPFSVQT